ncbi:uncharacterized protein F4822DRAFT_404991 [Hypoxylon trugodes]|uniref:uncharacterized protein n=1 Tax=Hypoxylon trugodes TaxID=326681 RepID=UPI0021918B90|nr:uncharacterized protein F4822DRAFT_404991 [Hypoxylon trugodes]KAI1389110.1 hypothetical protein F4822DRAFT_404991 [Hypoxylon trugodes]
MREMLQRPRDLAIAYVQYHQYPASSIATRTQSVPNCHINSFNAFESTWNATKARLVAKWEKINNARREHRLKRSMVKKLTPLRSTVTEIHLLGPTSVGDSQNRGAKPVAFPGQLEAENSFVEKTSSINEIPKRCLTESNVCMVELNTQNDGTKLGEISQEQSKSAGPMDSERKASAAQGLSHCQLDHKGERKLTPDQYVAIKKQEAVALVMAHFNRWLNKRLEIISYAYEASEASGNSVNNSGSVGSGSGDAGQGRSTRSTRAKRRLGGDDQDNSSAGGNEGDPSRGGNKRAKKDIEPDRKFACPFYKHDPKTHSKHRSCAGPGWASLHRLKEHLYRAHRLPKYTCPRCSEPFEDAQDLADHIRADVPCEKLDVVPAFQGIDEATEAKLKMRKKNCPEKTDEQRWRDIYMILFPGANIQAIPSPYYDSNDSQRYSKNIEQWRKVRKRMENELPDLVQKKVERSFEKVEVEVLNQLPNIIRDGLFEFFKDLPRDDRSASATPAVTPRAHTPSFPVIEEQPAAATDEVKDISLDLSQWLEPDMSFFGGFEEVNFTDFPYTSCEFANSAECRLYDRESDSGYASTIAGRDGAVETET